jgi:murein DD-endopeptidase MepM/ murein hydrolase activator NlpD
MVAGLALLVSAPRAHALELHGKPTQGGLLKGKVEVGSKVFLDERPVNVTSDGYFLLGFGRDAPLKATLLIERSDGKREIHPIKLEKRVYQEQRIDGLPDKQVSPGPKELKRIQAEQVLLNAARAREDELQYFLGEFIWPVKGRVSGVYGSRRILNGEPKRPHMGFDIAAPEGTPVIAPVDGVVSLVHPDMFYTGGTVMLHHGYGLSTMYIHLSEIFVEEGQHIKQGEKIAAVGMSGRATGPHLHWGMTLHKTFLDPALLLPEIE